MLAGMLALWGALGLLPWYAALIVRRRALPVAALPLALAAGVAGGALVPALGAKGELGVTVSLATAVVAAALATAATNLRKIGATDAHG